MKFKILLLSILACGYSYGQVCGTSYEDELTHEAAYKAAALQSSEFRATSRATIYVPVTFHLVARTDGTGRLLPSYAIEMLDAVNIFWKSQNVIFYIKSFNNINNDFLFNTPASTAGMSQMQFTKDKKTTGGSLNCYITGACETGNAIGGTTLGYYSSGGTGYSEDWVVIKKDQINRANASTAAHEFGHFFSLRHPFWGWDSEVYDRTKHGACVGPLSPGGIPNENQPRTGPQSNCTIGGDYLCDTEADYNLGFKAGSNCTYTDTVKDQNCVLLTPDPKLMMGYFSGCGSKYYFTPQQQNLVLTNYNSTGRTYLRNAVSPGALLPIAASPNLKLPTNGATQQSITGLTLDWDDVANATDYVIEMDNFISLDVNPLYFTSKTSSFTIPTTLLLNKKYFWRVIAYNAGNYQGTLSSNFLFTTGNVSTESINSISQMTVSPNPISNGILNLKFDNNASFEGKIKITDVTGKVIKIMTQKINVGNYNESIDVQELSNGLYILSLENETAINTEKFVVAK